MARSNAADDCAPEENSHHMERAAIGERVRAQESLSAGPTAPAQTSPVSTESRAYVERLIDILVCPDCKTPVQRSSPGLGCPHCGRAFPVADARLPIMFGSSSEFVGSTVAHASWRDSDQPRDISLSYRARRRFPSTTPYDLCRDTLHGVVASAGADGWVLNLGSGRMPARGPNWINFDIQPHVHCQLVGDAHSLPLADASVAAVLSQNVFEALKNPFLVAEELWRVCRPGALVFVQTAFLLPLLNAGRGDCFRFTESGLSSIFSGWDIVALGPSAGPFKALSRQVERTIDVVLGGGKLSFVFSWAAAWLLQPLKRLDPWALRRAQGATAASSYYIVARRR